MNKKDPHEEPKDANLEPENTEDAPKEDGAAGQEQDSPASPWDKSGEPYDAERAAKLISNQREENARLKAELSKLKAAGQDAQQSKQPEEPQEDSEATPADGEKASEANGEEKPEEETPSEGEEQPEEPQEDSEATTAQRLEAAEAKLAESEAKLKKISALAEASLPLDLVAYVPGQSDEEIAASVQFLLEKFNEVRASAGRAPSVNLAQGTGESPESARESAARAFFGM